MKIPVSRRFTSGISLLAVALVVGCGPTRAAANAVPGDVDQSVTLAQDGATSFVAPVDLPTPDAARPVFAHYMPVFPRSLDNLPAADDYYNTQYLRSSGENGKFSRIGGLVRDRPMPRTPIQEPDWAQQDLQHEVHDAIEAGISGFSMDVLETSGPNWERTKAMFTAATAEDARFRIMIQPDMTAEPADMSPQDLADKMSELASQPAAYRSTNGRIVVSPFAAEAKDPAWWKQFNEAMAAHGQPVDLLPIFVNVGDNIRRFADVSYGMGEWGSRTASVIDASPDYAAQAHALGKIWVSPISAQDVRPRTSTYMESKNMAGLRASWAKAIRTHADMALMVSWNDYSESSQFAPSIDHGYSLLELSSYYLDWFRREAEPTLERDAAFASFRIQRAATVPSAQPQIMHVSQVETTPASDNVEVVTLVKSPTEVAVEIGGHWNYFQAPAGLFIKTFPLAEGKVRLVAIRNGQVVSAMLSGQSVDSNVAIQDLAYHMIGSVHP